MPPKSKRCNTCGFPVKGHNGPHGDKCTNATYDKDAEQSVDSSGLPWNFDSFTMEQLRTFAMNSQMTVASLRAASAGTPASPHVQPQTGVPVQPGVPGLQSVPLQTQPGQHTPGVAAAYGQIHPGGLAHGYQVILSCLLLLGIL